MNRKYPIFSVFRPSKKLDPFIKEETEGRVKITKVEFREHGKNSAMYEEASSNEKLENVLKTLSSL